MAPTKRSPTPTMPPDGYLTGTEAAERLGVTRQRVQMLAQAGRIGSVRVGRRRFYCAADVEAYRQAMTALEQRWRAG